MNNLALDLIKVTEAGALAAYKLIGSGDKEAIDKVATYAMRESLNKIEFSAQIAIGEGKKDKSHGMFEGERVGYLYGHSSVEDYDIAIDPVEGTKQVSVGGRYAISTLALSYSETMYRTDSFYMNKIIYGRQIADKLSLHLNDSIKETVRLISHAIGKNPSEINICMLNRDRNRETIEKFKWSGVNVKLIEDCDLVWAISACMEPKLSGIDLVYGIGGATETVLSACAAKCLGGDVQAQDVDENWNGIGPILQLDDLVSGDCMFVATGITAGSFLDGVYNKDTHSLLLNSSDKTIREVITTHV